uniref:Si:ch211-107n13.1 n=1 Tax=Neogobius melanostomus TaxID=47308 RepID=A0A8C6UT16_9GOBI
MKPLTPIGSPSPLRLLNKGPDYLRRQIDGGSHGRSISAVERLEADKAKYVKSQQVINTKQEPALVPCATPPPRRLVAPHSAPVLRRSTGKRMLRPDSLVIYRQKKECKSPTSSAPGENNISEIRGYSFVRRLFQGSMREKNSRIKMDHDRSPGDHDENDPWKRASPPAHRRQLGDLRRSKSDLQIRCSVALSEQEHFFAFCGLDMDLIERLGRDNFLSGASSIDTLSLALRSVAEDVCGGSEPSEFSRHSGDGLFEEELVETLPTGVSIIERNARVIKWLYGCKNAAREGPKESTV